MIIKKIKLQLKKTMINKKINAYKYYKKTPSRNF